MRGRDHRGGLLGDRRRDHARQGRDFRLPPARGGRRGRGRVALEHVSGDRRRHPSFSYQFSFETRADWSRVYAPGSELKATPSTASTSTGSATRSGSARKVIARQFDEDNDMWRLETPDGEAVTARYVVGAPARSHSRSARHRGLESFAGITMHTSRWDHDVDLAGKHVGVVGTGASAVQVIPAIAAEVAKLTVFQRTPIWCLPKPDRPLGDRERWVLERSRRATRGAPAQSGVRRAELPARRRTSPESCRLADRGEKVGRAFLRQRFATRRSATS